MAEILNIHAILPSSRVNGPGKRLVVFFQGCSRGCAGCFNPETHPFEKRLQLSAEEIFKKYYTGSVEGLSVSGGEPFMQAKGLRELLAHSGRLGLTNLVYTGFTIEELKADPEKASALGLIDVLIDGPYQQDMKETGLLPRGSTNQRIYLLSGRYTAADLIMPGRIEVNISREGVITETGFGYITLRECV